MLNSTKHKSWFCAAIEVVNATNPYMMRLHAHAHGTYVGLCLNEGKILCNSSQSAAPGVTVLYIKKPNTLQFHLSISQWKFTIHVCRNIDKSSHWSYSEVPHDIWSETLRIPFLNPSVYPEECTRLLFSMCILKLLFCMHLYLLRKERKKHWISLDEIYPLADCNMGFDNCINK